MDIISIDEFIANIPDDELLIISDINPSIDIIFAAFVEDPKLNAVKYTMQSKNIIIDPLTHKKYFEIPRYCVDIITNIRCNNDTIFLLNNQIRPCNISKLTLPIANMQYTTSKLEVVSEHDIIYDAYLLSDNLRDQLRKKRVINSENMLFYGGGAYNHDSSI